MDIQQLRYVVEIARTGSITKAAKNLYMGQPNLSKSIRELEAETGLTLFRRTSRGVAPTENGADFIGCARSIVAQMDSLETLYTQAPGSAPRLCVAVPRASYIASAFSRYAAGANVLSLELQYRETNAANTVNDVAAGSAGLGIVRYAAQHEAYYDGLIRRAGLRQELLWEFCMVVLMHESHPLAGLPEIPYHLLADYPQLVHGDYAPPLPPDAAARGRETRGGRIAVFDRAGQFELLRSVPGSYMWVSPVPFEILARQELVQKPCRARETWRDVAVWPHALSAPEQAFLAAVRAEIDTLRPLVDGAH